MAHQIYRISPQGKPILKLHWGQRLAWESSKRFVAVISGTQGGKTSFAPWWLWREIQRGGAGDYIAATSSYDLFKLKFLPEMRTVFENVLKIGRYWASDRILEIQNPATGKFEASRADDAMFARIILRSAASGSGLESTTAKAAVLDEAGQDEFTVETWEALLRRLSLARGRALITTTPYNLGWLKTEVYDRWEAGDSDYDVVQFASIMNPLFPREEYDRAKRTMQRWKFDMFYRGIFTKPAGLIYSDFERSTMVCPPLHIPPHWPRFVGVDFGGVNTSTVWLALEPRSETVYLYHESLEGDLTSQEHAARALAKVGDAQQVIAVGGAPSEEQQRRDFAAGGFSIARPPVSDVESGIDRVTQLIKKPGQFRIFDTCTGILDELGRYQRVVDGNGEPTAAIQNKNVFHRLDALRYVATVLMTQG